ncbi:MAG: cobalt-precorrin-5B (C(1))-methyltransferase CbiD [Candidatus Bathyarchaeota archaeon]|nr:cobalt-precorrin-5B (C(1))-methyltransferase CbiD [Candidatus Bathyarchaeota archaeon]MCX8177210.1 cobalt-precorrin-5B (C(1))-methyltransferase CbiD [Candidatus Bathyarchaeota archaeon]MDW8193547.1 cobalt-precorrin-5B (C(1))-methyltransferase CbiD [Nitrososphaerota archaeon]
MHYWRLQNAKQPGCEAEKLKFLKYGISTGACAAAAAKAAVLTLIDKPADHVGVPTPIGLRLEVPIEGCRKLDANKAVAWVVKNAGDDADATDGLRIYATVKLTDDGEVVIKGGRGVGRVTKPGLTVSIGEPAINPVPRIMIRDAVREVIPTGRGAEILIEVPGGEEVAEKTLNPKLGIVGGISILGTAGIVKPYSLEAYRRSLLPQIDIALSSGRDCIFLVPGNIGAKIAKQLFNVSEDMVVQTGDFVGYMLRKAVEKGARNIILLGHAGKLVKLAAGVFNTHYRVADARMEVIAAYAGAAGASSQLITRILASNTTEEVIKWLKEANLMRQTFDAIAEKIRVRCLEKIKGKAEISVLIVSLEGEILGASGKAECVEKWRKST